MQTKRDRQGQESEHPTTISVIRIHEILEPTALSFGACGDFIRQVLRYDSQRQPMRSIVSFALAAAIVCHCMLLGMSEPPQASGLM